MQIGNITLTESLSQMEKREQKEVTEYWPSHLIRSFTVADHISVFIVGTRLLFKKEHCSCKAIQLIERYKLFHGYHVTEDSSPSFPFL